MLGKEKTARSRLAPRYALAVRKKRGIPDFNGHTSHPTFLSSSSTCGALLCSLNEAFSSPALIYLQAQYCCCSSRTLSLSLSSLSFSLALTLSRTPTISRKKFPRSILAIAPSQTSHISIKVDLIRTRFNSKNSCQLAPSHLYILPKNYITKIFIE